jgi:quercetin dioxygenase-like cupin family protein
VELRHVPPASAERVSEGRARIVAAAAGEALWFLGTLAIIRIDADDTDGRFSLTENILPKDSAPPVHSHPQSETFYVLDGEMTIWIDGKPSKCAAGSTAHAPAGVPHTFLVTSETMRVLTLSVPAGIERFFQSARPARKGATHPR